MGGLLAGVSSIEPQPGNGLCFIVVNLEAFLPKNDFAALTEQLRPYLKSCPPAANHREITLAGQLEFSLMEGRSAHGIPFDPQTWEQICRSGESIGVRWSDFSTKGEAPHGER